MFGLEEHGSRYHLGTRNTMKYIFSLIFLLVASVSGFAQTNFTAVMVDTNGVVQRPTNFWSNAPTSISSIDLSTTNATGILPVANGGSGATTGAGALTNFGVFAAASGLLITTATNVYPNFATVIGVNATNATGGAGNTVIGYGAAGATDSTDLGGVAVGRGAYTELDGTAVGNSARASVGTALGTRAVATNGGVQIGVGTNSTSSTIQFRSAGLVDTNEWSALANSSTQGRYAMTNTSGISATNTIIGYDGTNYVTNTITVINGIITSWTQ